MSLHDDLLAQADFLARIEPKRPKQESLRRAVSSACHALLHLLTWETSRLDAEDFGPASRVDESLDQSSDLQFVAATFTTLQQLRRQAGHDSMRKFSRQEVLALVAQARRAFDAWGRIRGTDEARVFLASFRRREERIQSPP
jgi:hypothetical protein